MPLYSSEAHANAVDGKYGRGLELVSNPESGVCVDADATVGSWCYLFVHRNKVEAVCEKMRQAGYPVFVHKTIMYKREDKRIKKYEQHTISGLVFIKGDSGEIQALLKRTFSFLYLAKDCSTGEIAVISDLAMRPFMLLSEVNPTRIRFMPHSIGYYSAGNPLVRITSGILAGLEGYRIRISRDKCLVTTFGGLTVAIGGIYKENFENLDEYVRQRREMLKIGKDKSGAMLTPLQQEIDSCFFRLQSRLDVIAVSDRLEQWVARIMADVKAKNFDEAVEIALFMLEKAGVSLRYGDGSIGDVKELMQVCWNVDSALAAVLDSVDVSSDLKEIVEVGRESLAIRFPVLPIGI